MIAAIEIPSDIDLGRFSARLHAERIAHRITLEGVNQVVWVPGEPERDIVVRYYRLMVAGELDLPAADGMPSRRTFSLPGRIAANARRFPFTMGLIAVNLLLLPVGLSEPGSIYAGLLLLRFGDVTPAQLSLADTLASGEWWRLLTPMFLHFTWLHITFNLLWTWEVGRRIEFVNGASVAAVVTATASLAANLTQYALGPIAPFGGMSGVVYGYLGFCLAWDRLVPARPSGVVPGVYVFMLVFLALGFTGYLDLPGLGRLANGAHLGGLVGGVVVGAVTAATAVWRSRQSREVR